MHSYEHMNHMHEPNKKHIGRPSEPRRSRNHLLGATLLCRMICVGIYDHFAVAHDHVIDRLA